jgi:serine/threonine protein phosphatase PrpC
MKCPACNLEQTDGIRFCEDCGGPMSASSLTPRAAASVPTCAHCGAAFDPRADDFCPRCGAERASVVDDHIELAVSANLAGVSDRGTVRRRNEDFFALASRDGIDVLVVCDGVSKSQQADRAARVAAITVCSSIVEALSPCPGTPGQGGGEGDFGNQTVSANRNHPHPDPLAGSRPIRSLFPEDRERGPEQAIADAIRTADEKVRALPEVASVPGDPAETTIVVAVRRGDLLTVAWLGDSRAYWIDDTGLRPLTEDHSWLNETVAAGTMTRGVAMLHTNAHSITRTLGGPISGDGADEPSFAQFDIGVDLHKPGMLLLCTDGFWDFHDDDAQFAAAVIGRVRDRPAGDDALSLARRLVEQACTHRGHDNTTAVTAAMAPAGSARPTANESGITP